MTGQVMWDRNLFVVRCRALLKEKGQFVSVAHEDEHLRRLLLLAACSGSLTGASAMVYDDDQITVIGSTSDKSMSIVRKENQNPVVSVKADGMVIRTHGEIRLLIPHLDKLMPKLIAEPHTEAAATRFMNHPGKWHCFNDCQGEEVYSDEELESMGIDHDIDGLCGRCKKRTATFKKSD